MNRAGNERYRETERRLTEAFLRLLEKKELREITVRELCGACGIHRSSFYLHFQDVYALMESVEGDLAQYYGQLFTQERGTYRLRDRFLQLFRFIREHRSFYRVYWSRARDLRVLHAAVPEDLESRLETYQRQAGIRSGAELRYHRLFFTSGLAAMIGYWLSRDCRETPEDMVRMLEQEYAGRSEPGV